jgi:hypothetical protein
MIEPEPKAFDRRPEPRKRVLLSGLIVYGHGALTCDCTFRNVSTGGARIRLPYMLALPNRFHVINVREGVAHHARVAWNKGLELGIRFDTSISLSAKPDILFERLKKLWLAKATR